MYGLGNLADFCEAEGRVFWLTARKRNETWLCNSVTPVAKAIDTKGSLWGFVFKFVDLDGVPAVIAVNRRLINKSGVRLAKGFARWGLCVNPGYERQFAAYLSAMLEPIKSKKTVTQTPKETLNKSPCRTHQQHHIAGSLEDNKNEADGLYLGGA